MLTDALMRIRSLLFRERVEREMDEEFRFHLERDIEERVRRGTDPVTARRQAIAELGGLERRKEEVREARGTLALEELAGDVRHAARTLLRNPAFASTAVVVLALGIGATASVFGIADAVLLARLPYPEPDRIVRLFEQNSPTNRWNVSAADAKAIFAQQKSFSAVGVMQRNQAALSINGTPERANTLKATSGYFRALGLTPVAGRLIEAADEAPGAPDVIVLSQPVASRAFGDARAAIGRSVLIDGISHTVVGVMPWEANVLTGASYSAWRVLRVPPPARRGPFPFAGIARLREGATLESARRDLSTISRSMDGLYSDWHDGTASITAYPLREIVVGKDAETQVYVLAAGVLLVLFVAIANVALLMLVRASSRQAELAVRSALGASRVRLVRLVATESFLISVAAGALGIGIAYVVLRAAPTLMPHLPRIQNASANLRVMGAAAAAALVCACFVTLAPMLSAFVRVDGDSIRADVKRVGTDRRGNFLRGVLVSAEFGLALPLLFGAGLLLSTFMRLQRVDAGFDAQGVVTMAIWLPDTRYQRVADRQAFWQRAIQLASQIEGVTSVGVSTSLPPEGSGDSNNFNLVDHPVANGQSEHISTFSNITSGYLDALKVPLVAGRKFTQADEDTTALPVAIVSRAWAQKYYPNEDPLGRQFVSGGCYDCPHTTIVGVVGDVKYDGLTSGGASVYTPFYPAIRSADLVVRGGANTASTTREVQKIVASLDPQLVTEPSTLSEKLDQALANPFRWSTIVGSFSAVTLLLAAVGIFGLMSYAVRQRRREIGVRMALGARPSAVVWMIVGRGMRYAAIGTVAGLGLAVLEGRWIAGLLFGVGALDPTTLIGVTVVLLASAASASWVAGRSAARIHPVEAIASS